MADFGRIRSLVKEERFKAAYEMFKDDPDIKNSPEGARLLGLACMRMNKHAEAAAFYEIVCNHSNNSEDWYNLAMARLLGGDVVHGVIALEEAKRRYNKGYENMSVEQMLFYFVGGLLDQGMWDAAKRYLRELADIYIKLGNTNDRNLYAREIPYFGWFLNAVLTAYRNSNSQRAGVDWLRKILPQLDPEGQAKANMTIRLLSQDNPRTAK